MHHFDYEHVAELRQRLIPYDRVEAFVSPSEGDIILDIGAGDGFYSANFAKKVGSGRVVAYEIDERGADIIRKTLKEKGIDNVEVVVQDICKGISAEGYSKVFFSNAFHDLPCRDYLLDHLKEKGGANLEVILIEFRKDVLEAGPPEEIRISEDSLEAMFKSRGFVLKDRLLLSHHYLHRYVAD